MSDTHNFSLDAFLARLVAEKSPTLPDELRHKMMDDLRPRLNQWVLIKVTERLGPDDVRALDAYAEGQTSSVDIGKIMQGVPGIEEHVAQALMEFRSIYLQS